MHGNNSETQVPLNGGDEYDILTKARKYYKLGRGITKWAKNKYRRRVRRETKVEIIKQLSE